MVPIVLLMSKGESIPVQKHPIGPYMWITALASVYELIFTIYLKLATVYWFQLFSFLEFLTLAYFYKRCLKGRYKKWLWFLLLSMVFLMLLSILIWGKDNEWIVWSLSRIPIAVMVVLFSLLWFIETLARKSVFEWRKSSEFLFMFGFLSYYTTTFLLFMFAHPLFEENSAAISDYWFINVGAVFFLRIILIIGTWKMKHQFH